MTDQPNTNQVRLGCKVPVTPPYKKGETVRAHKKHSGEAVDYTVSEITMVSTPEGDWEWHVFFAVEDPAKAMEDLATVQRINQRLAESPH